MNLPLSTNRRDSFYRDAPWNFHLATFTSEQRFVFIMGLSVRRGSPKFIERSRTREGCSLFIHFTSRPRRDLPLSRKIRFSEIYRSEACTRARARETSHFRWRSRDLIGSEETSKIHRPEAAEKKKKTPRVCLARTILRCVCVHRPSSTGTIYLTPDFG